MNRVLLISIVFAALLLSFGCLAYDVRQELPEKIKVTEAPVAVQESPIECKQASCLAIMKDVDQKNTRWDCAPPFKGANDDPAGNIYYQDKGDKCNVLPAPDTLCLRYDCAFSKETNTGYYTLYYACLTGGIDHDGTGFGIAYPNQDVSLMRFVTAGLGSIGELPDNKNFACNAVSSESRDSGYNTNCDYQQGCYTCPESAMLLSAMPRACPAEMPILYPFNAKGFEYTPVRSSQSDPGKNVIRNLQLDYTKLLADAEAYTKSATARPANEKDENNIPACKSICSNLADNPENVDECNKCNKEHANDDLKEPPEKEGEKPVARGYTQGDLLSKKCNGLNPCVEIDRAGVGTGTVSYKIGDDTYAKCGEGSYENDELRYFLCKCRCSATIRATYECSRAGSTTKYYYSYCKETKDKTSQGGYIYEFHNFGGGAYSAVLGNATSEIPVFMLGQGPTFKDYELAKRLCKPSNPADISIMAGKLPFSPNSTTVLEGGQVCLSNIGAGTHIIYKDGLSVPLANLSSGSGICFPSGANTNFTLGTHTLRIDDNRKALATVKVQKPAQEGAVGIVTLDENGQPIFLYNGELRLDALYASGAKGNVAIYVREKDGSLRALAGVEAGEYNGTVGGNKFTYIAYDAGSKIEMFSGGMQIFSPTGEKIGALGADRAVFSPRAIVLPLGSKLCVTNHIKDVAKNLVLEMKVNYTPEMYIPIAAKRSLYGLECCFDVPDPGVYRVSDLDYPGNMKAYAVVLPRDVMSSITIDDYAYSPYSSLGKRDDYVCITNPVGVERDISYRSDAGTSGRFRVKAQDDYCTYELTKIEANYNFTDETTGAGFFLSTTQGDVLNIDVRGISFTPANGRVGQGGQVCLNAVDTNATIIIAQVPSADTLAKPNLEGTQITLAPGQKRCINMPVSGLYVLRNKDSGLNCLVAVGGADTTYIVNSLAVPATLDVKFPDYMSASQDPLGISVFTKYPTIKVWNKDTENYAVYNELYIRNGTGFSTAQLQLITPHTIVYNKAPYDVSIEIISYTAFKSRTISIPAGKYAIYTYQNGDYRIKSITNLQLNLPEVPKDMQLGAAVDIISDKMLNASGIVLNRGGMQEFDVRSIGGILVNYYGINGSVGNLTSEPIKKGMFIIRGSVEGGEAAIISRQGSFKTLGFGVQTLSGVPTSNELQQARAMLAYDNSLPVFLYSRIGSVKVNLVDPATPETYPINVGTPVNVRLDKDLEVSSVTPSPSGDVGAFDSANKKWSFTMPAHNVNFTIKSGSVQKQVNLAPQQSIKEVRMSYTQYRVDTHNSTGSYMIRVHNLADDPRAIMLRPANISDYCTIAKPLSTIKPEKNLVQMWSPTKMVVYNASSDDINALENHDRFVSAATFKVSDITLLPNMGYRKVNLSLGRSGSKPTGQLMLRASVDDNDIVKNTHAANLGSKNFELQPGYISGLTSELASLREYRIFSSDVKGGGFGEPRYLDIGISTDVYKDNKGNDGYAVIGRMFSNPKTSKFLIVKNTKETINGSGAFVWKGAIFRINGYKILPNRWVLGDYANPSETALTGCGRNSFIVPFDYKYYPKDFAYDVPAIFGDVQGYNSMYDFAYRPDSYDYLHTLSQGTSFKKDYMVQAIGYVPYSNFTIVLKNDNWGKRGIYDVKGTGDGKLNLIPPSMRIINGEVMADMAFTFVTREGVWPCGKLNTSAAIRDGEGGKPFTRSEFSGVYDFDFGGKCGFGNKFESKFGNEEYFKTAVIWNRWGELCGFGGASGCEIAFDDKCKDREGTENVWWCRYSPPDYSHCTTTRASREGGKDWWNLLTTDSGSSGIDVYDTGTGTYGVSRSFTISKPVSGAQPIDFIDDYYYEFVDGNCDRECKDASISNVVGNKVQGGAREGAFAGGLFVALNSLEPGMYYFQGEYDSKTTCLSTGYALTESFDMYTGSSRKAVCYGDSSFDGVQEVIAPLATKTYMPDAHGQYAIYDSPYYPNFQLEGASFNHISPFAADAAGDANARRSIDSGLLGKVDYDVPKLTAYNRYYRDARWSIDGILGEGDVSKGDGDGRMHVADVYLYNLTLTAVTNNIEISTDTVDLAEGEVLLLNNTGTESIEWYYGKLTPCIKDDDLNDIINKKMNSNCPKSVSECIRNPKTYSISPTDMSNYLADLSALNKTVGKLLLAPGEKRLASTVQQPSVQGAVPLTLDSGEQTATYLFYNPHSGKRLSVRITRPVTDILLQINSFSPSFVSVQPGAADNRLCIYNKDNRSRDIIYEGTDGSKTTVSIASGTSDCKNPGYFDKYKAKDALTGKYLTVISETVGSENVISMLENITRAIALSEVGADNPAYKFQVLNPKAPATPSFITSELLDVDMLVNAPSQQQQQYYRGVAREIEKIEAVCRSQQIETAGQCVQPSLSPSENVAVVVNFSDVWLSGCCCRALGTGTECKREITEAECSLLKKQDPRWNFAQCPIGCCCKANSNSGNRVCISPPISEKECNDKYKTDNYVYTYFCPSNATVYKQRCISTLPFFIHVQSSDTGISTERINAMKKAIDNVNSELNKGTLAGQGGGKLDMIGYVVIIDDPGISKRGNCTISKYLAGLRNVSQYAVTKYGIPSIIIGFGLNRNTDESKSCWHNTELAAQARQLFTEDIIMLIGSGIIGMGQYCLVDTSCQPISTSTSGGDYGLFYDSLASGSKPFAYGVGGRADVVTGIPSISSYIASMPPTSFGSGTFAGTPAGSQFSIFGPNIVLPTRDSIYLDEIRQNSTGRHSYSSVKPTGFDGLPSGIPTVLPGSTTFDMGTLGGASLPPAEGISGLSTGTGLQGIDMVSEYLKFLQDSGVNVGSVTNISLLDILKNISSLNDPSSVLAGTVRKDPYARAWFDQCGKYYYEGEGQSLLIFSESDIPKGQQGNQCDPSRMMELYKKYKCE